MTIVNYASSPTSVSEYLEENIMSEKYDYKYEERRRIIKQINNCRAHKQSEIVPGLEEMVTAIFADVADPRNQDWFTKPSITLTPEQAVHIEGYLHRFQNSAEKLIHFLDFIEDRGQISLWEEYQQEVDRRGSYGSTGAKTPDALKKV